MWLGAVVGAVSNQADSILKRLSEGQRGWGREGWGGIRVYA